jgi:hypothetical protein
MPNPLSFSMDSMIWEDGQAEDAPVAADSVQ